MYTTEAKEERTSPPLMLKTRPPSTFIADFVIVQFFNEITFYTRALPILQQQGDVQPLLAKFYDSFVHCNSTDTQFLLIYEDLRSLGFRNHKRYSFLDVDHLCLMLRQLGRFHSYSYRAKRDTPKEFQTIGRWLRDAQSEMVYDLPSLINSSSSRGFNHLRRDTRYSGRLANLEELLKHANKFMHQWNTQEQDQPMSVLCHGDYLRGNVMFRYENDQPVELKMIDVATARLSSPVIDLSGLLYLNANQETRDQHWDRLIDSYYVGLSEVFGADAVPSKVSIMKEFKNKVIYAYYIASYFLPRVISLDLGKPDFEELLPEQYSTVPESEIPADIIEGVYQIWGGEESTEALVNILKDMIDRGFI